MSFSYTNIDNPTGTGPFDFSQTYSDSSEIVVFGYNGKNWSNLEIASVSGQQVTLTNAADAYSSIRISNNSAKVNSPTTNGSDGNVVESGDSVHGDIQVSLIDPTDKTGNSPLTPETVTLGGISSFVGSKSYGFLDYNHDNGSEALVADTWTDVPNNGAGAFTNTAYGPEGVTSLMDTNTGYLDFTELSLGSEILVRNDFTVVPNTNNALLEVRYLLGTGAGEYALLFWSERLDSGSGINYQRVIPFPIYMGDLNTRDNAGKLQVKLSTTGTLTNAGSYISIRVK